MDFSEALRTIDATVGMFKDLHPLGEWDEDFLQAPVKVSFQDSYDENSNPRKERKIYFYHKWLKRDIKIVDITPVCKFLVNEWPSPQTRQLRKRLMKAYDLCYEAAKDSLYLSSSFLYDTKWWEKEHYSFSRQNRQKYDLYDALTDTLHEMYQAIKATEDEEPTERQEYTVAEEEKNYVKEIDWVKATNKFNPGAIKDVVNTGRNKRERRIIIKAIRDAMTATGEMYKIPYSVDGLLLDLFKENNGSRKGLLKAYDESSETLNLDEFVQYAIEEYMNSQEASDADIDEIFPEDNKNGSETKKETQKESNTIQDDPSSDESELPDCSGAPKKCFRFPNDFTKQFVGKVVNDYYFGKYANLALIEVTLFDHQQLQKRDSHTAFVQSLVYWGFIEAKKAKVIKKIISGVADKYKRLPKDGYIDWPERNKNDKNTCIKIGNSLDPSMKYLREKTE